MLAVKERFLAVLRYISYFRSVWGATVPFLKCSPRGVSLYLVACVGAWLGVLPPCIDRGVPTAVSTQRKQGILREEMKQQGHRQPPYPYFLACMLAFREGKEEKPSPVIDPPPLRDFTSFSAV